jgi:hypothetical protein
MQSRLFDEQQRLQCDERTGQTIGAGAGENAGDEHHQCRDLGGGIDVLSTGGSVRDRDDRDRPSKNDCCGRCETCGPQPPRESGNRSEHRERPNAGESCVGTVGMPRPLPLEADSHAAQRGDCETQQV